MRILCSLHTSSFSQRGIHLSSQLEKIVPTNLKGKNKNAQEWLMRQLNDPYVKRSRYDNYRARSAYKLLELDEKYKIFIPGMTVVDCGASPGSWTQVLVPRVNADQKLKNKPKGTVIAIDIVPFEPVPHAQCFGEVDCLSQASLERITQELKLGSSLMCDFVVSDMAPKATGVPSMDHENIVALSYAALGFALRTLKPGGGFICKLWHGVRTPEIKADLKTYFDIVNIAKPNASRDDSAEIYFVADKFKGIQ